jgi:hypothetical protein
MRAGGYFQIIGHQYRLIRVGAEEEGSHCQGGREHDQEHQGGSTIKQ